ncbi:1,3-beta-glucanosyltransferase gas1 [Emmonsiellopsis sp. PD_33]|nr:1,3-beta-glucanosyltransferase gas1 [Emmonsiellopsis sp. PD_33]
MKFSSLLAGAALVAGSAIAAELDPIVIKGSKFFYKSSGKEFFMKGVAYQQEISSNGTTNGSNKYTDPLADVEACTRDIPLLEELETNTIRVYAIDPKKDHTVCMNLLQEAGIYVVADLSEPATSIIRSDPKWNDVLYERYTAVIDELAPYSNVMGFFAGNEVSNNKTNTDASAFVKAAVRDMKAYMKQKKYRAIGVGYATNDDADIREDMSDYFNCNSREEAIDFWGYNIYSWCGDSSYTKSGYDVVVKEFSTYSVPVFFAEYGCNEVKPRKFTDVAALYGPKMTPVVSGGIVYMYFQEANEYGLVDVKGDKVTRRADFKNLKEQISKVNPTGVKMSEYKPTNDALQTCPDNKSWKANKVLPPTPNKDLCGCMVKSLSCVAKSSITDKEMGKQFGLVCGMGENTCAGISADAEKGVYGAYSMCSPREQLSFAFNNYYQQQTKAGNGDNACDFDGKAQRQSATESKGTCADLMEQAGSDGTGQITGGPGAASTSSGAAFPTGVPAFDFGLLKLGAYVVSAMFAGVGVILL